MAEADRELMLMEEGVPNTDVIRGPGPMEREGQGRGGRYLKVLYVTQRFVNSFTNLFLNKLYFRSVYVYRNVDWVDCRYVQCQTVHILD